MRLISQPHKSHQSAPSVTKITSQNFTNIRVCHTTVDVQRPQYPTFFSRKGLLGAFASPASFITFIESKISSYSATQIFMYNQKRVPLSACNKARQHFAKIVPYFTTINRHQEPASGQACNFIKIPIDLFIVFCGGVLYTKWLLFLYVMWGMLITAFLCANFFFFSSSFCPFMRGRHSPASL